MSHLTSSHPEPIVDRVPPVPLILVMGCTPQFAERCRLAAEATDALIVEADIVGLRALSLSWRPIAIILPDDAYRRESAAFDRLARRSKAKLLRIPNENVHTSTLQREIVLAVRAVYYS